MDPTPPKRTLASVAIAIVLAPFAVAFFIAASLAAGPREAFKGIFGRSDGRKRKD